ncbi:MAG: hypothetical protein IE931_05330 [Sphingobacteriales bacterium]|nr:hypothetical protein [Sphingobacteriales bacterium]
MNLKRTFGAILTILGIVGMIYTAVSVIQNSGEIKTSIVLGILGIIFFVTGISLIRTTKDEA